MIDGLSLLAAWGLTFAALSMAHLWLSLRYRDSETAGAEVAT
jgi:hypothetical protein